MPEKAIQKYKLIKLIKDERATPKDGQTWICGGSHEKKNLAS